MGHYEDARFIGEIIAEAGLITPEQLKQALDALRGKNRFIVGVLQDLEFAEEEELLAFLSTKLKIPYVKIKNKEIKPACLNTIPASVATHYKIIPLELENERLTIAMANPLAVTTLDDLRLVCGLEVKGVLAGEREIEGAISKYYGVGADTLDKMMDTLPQDRQSAIEKSVEDLAASEDVSVVTFVNQILTEAIKSRATDIHFEPYEDGVRVRFRIDGVLYDISMPETINYVYNSVASRIKIMAKLDITERRLPQDGRIKIKLEDKELDLRISIIPSGFGEAVHIRILSHYFFLGLENLGLLPENLKIIEEVIRMPHGIVLVTGPTGSGKSTTLYACLARINSADVKIITIEDPIEYQLKGIVQIQVHSKIGLSFAQGFRHMLRHDPNVMMVGEIRDYETAEISIRAALTGHLIFSTLHTNDAAGAVTRLLDMGVEPFLLASSLNCLIAQRLVRIICPHCKNEVALQPEIAEKIKNLQPDAPLKVYQGSGCQECRFTGYQGRTAVYEIINVNDPIRELILSRTSSQHIKQKAISLGARTLFEDGLRKVIAGVTTVAEVLRVTQIEED